MVKASGKVLLIRTDRTGDFIIFSAVLKYYRELFKDCEIHLLVIPLVEPLARNCPYVDRITTFDTDHPSLKQIRRLKENFYEKIIYPVYSRCKDRDRVAILARGKEKICFDGDNSNDPKNLRFRYNKFFTTIIESEPGPKREIERNANFLMKLGHTGDLKLKTEIWFNKGDDIRFRQFKDKYKLKEKNYIVLSPGVRYSIKLWETTKWINLINKLFRITNSQILICGMEKDRVIAKEIIQKLDFNERVLNLVNKTDLRLLAKLIKGTSLCIGIDSAPIHIAAAVGTPNVCLIGGGHFGRFYPYGDLEKNRIVYYKMDCFGCNWNCKFQNKGILSKIKRRLPFLEDQDHGSWKCVKNIEVNDVLKEVEYLYARYHLPPAYNRWVID